jgi:hypothetical protein
MPVQPTVRAVFAHFQNLNLLALIHDLRCGQAALDGWSDAALLRRASSSGSPGPSTTNRAEMTLHVFDLLASPFVVRASARAGNRGLKPALRRASCSRIGVRAVARRSMGVREIAGRVDQGHVRERLREIADQALPLGIVLLGD